MASYILSNIYIRPSRSSELVYTVVTACNVCGVLTRMPLWTRKKKAGGRGQARQIGSPLITREKLCKWSVAPSPTAGLKMKME